MKDADYTCVSSDFTIYPPTVPNARAFTRWALEDGRPRLFTTYQCKWGFKPTAGGVRNVYCVNSTWIGATPKCQTVGKYMYRLKGVLFGSYGVPVPPNVGLKFRTPTFSYSIQMMPT